MDGFLLRAVFANGIAAPVRLFSKKEGAICLLCAQYDCSHTRLVIGQKI